MACLRLDHLENQCPPACCCSITDSNCGSLMGISARLPNCQKKKPNHNPPIAIGETISIQLSWKCPLVKAGNSVQPRSLTRMPSTRRETRTKFRGSGLMLRDNKNKNGAAK